jgi:ATP-dependent protease ClpP protease subunit
MEKNRFFNSAKADDGLTLSFYDAIGSDIFGEGITAQAVSDALKGDFKSITVRLNSPGGDAFVGTAIYNLLRSCSKPISVIVDGMAASAASIVAMAGDTITMNTGSVMMIHEAQALAIGDEDLMRKMADTLNKVTGTIADIYVAKTGLAKEKVLAMMKEETWMNGEEAVANKFATSVGKDAAVKNEYDLSVFKNVPITLQAKTKRVANEDLTAACFIYVGDPDKTDTWKLPWHFSSEEKTVSHLRNALARFDQAEIPEDHKAECWAKLVRLCKEHGIDVEAEKPKDEAYKISLLQKRLEIEKSR